MDYAGDLSQFETSDVEAKLLAELDAMTVSPDQFRIGEIVATLKTEFGWNYYGLAERYQGKIGCSRSNLQKYVQSMILISLATRNPETPFVVYQNAIPAERKAARGLPLATGTTVAPDIARAVRALGAARAEGKEVSDQRLSRGVTKNPAEQSGVYDRPEQQLFPKPRF